MLVLGRKYGESIVIPMDGDRRIKITFLGMSRRGENRIGIDAPSDLAILREELLDDGGDASRRAS